MKFGLREILLLAVLLALPVSSYFLVFRPQNAEIRQARQEVEHKREMLTKLRQMTARNADLQKANSEIAEQVRAIEARLPSTKEVDNVVRQVSDLAVEAGLEAPGVQSEKPVKAALYMEQPLTMTVNGDFNGFYQFMQKLEGMPRITRIPNMKLTRSATSDGHMKSEFVLSIYFQPEGQQR